MTDKDLSQFDTSELHDEIERRRAEEIAIRNAKFHKLSSFIKEHKEEMLLFFELGVASVAEDGIVFVDASDSGPLTKQQAQVRVRGLVEAYNSLGIKAALVIGKSRGATAQQGEPPMQIKVEGGTIADFQDRLEESGLYREGDARLMAAAPALLHALREVVEDSGVAEPVRWKILEEVERAGVSWRPRDTSYRVIHRTSGTVEDWTEFQVLSEINRDHSEDFSPYVPGDNWREGLREWTEWRAIDDPDQ